MHGQNHIKFTSNYSEDIYEVMKRWVRKQ